MTPPLHFLKCISVSAGVSYPDSQLVNCCYLVGGGMPPPYTVGFLNLKTVKILVKRCQLFKKVCHLVF